MRTITLKKPLIHKIKDKDDQEITEIGIREPSAGELRGVSLAEFGEMKVDVVLKLIPRLSQPSITESMAEDISPIDLLKIGAAMIGADDPNAGNDDAPPKA